MFHRKQQIDFVVVIGYLLISPFGIFETLFGNVCHFSFWLLFCVLCTVRFVWSLWKKKNYLSLSFGFWTCLFNACMVFHSIFHYNLHHHHHHRCRLCFFFRLLTKPLYYIIVIIIIFAKGLVGVGDNHSASAISTIKHMNGNYIVGATIWLWIINNMHIQRIINYLFRWLIL